MQKVLSFIIIIIAFAEQTKAQQTFANYENGIGYNIFHSKNATNKPLIKKGDVIAFSMFQKFGDSIAFNTYEAGHQILTVDDLKRALDFKFVLIKLKVDDSAVIGINTDSVYQQQVYYQKTNNPNFKEEEFRKTVPPFFLTHNNFLIFQIKILDKFTQNKKDKNYIADVQRFKAFQKKQIVKQDLFRKKLEAKEKKENDSIAKINIEIGNNFLKENKKNNKVIETASGLQYFKITTGKGQIPNIHNKVVCNYIGTKINGEEFENSYNIGKPVEFELNGVIKGWAEILKLMPVGSKYKVWIPSKLGYGNIGNGSTIQPGETLVFEIELLNIK